MAEDIKRHLRGLPVTARPNTFSYRAEKFVSRNKASVFAGVFDFFGDFRRNCRHALASTGCTGGKTNCTDGKSKSGKAF